jgi:hypothetical protein
MGFKNKRKMKYLKLFENIDILINEIENIIKPKMDKVFNFKNCASWYTDYWEEGDDYIGFGIVIESLPQKTEEYYDKNKILRKITDARIDYDKASIFIENIINQPDLPEYIKDVDVDHSIEEKGLYWITLYYSKNFLRSSKAGLWDLKTKEK